MTNLAQAIDDDIKSAMRAKEADKLSTLRLLKAAVKNAAIEKGGADYVLEDTAVISVIRKLIKQREDSIEAFTKGNRPEQAAKEQAEIEFLNAYLPQALSDGELDALIEAAKSELGATDKKMMGAVIKHVNEAAAGRAEGKRISQRVQQQLS
ncbi:MAG: GatB/YqeY domain-containing protein [Verrucomicrobiales bacterium]